MAEVPVKIEPQELIDSIIDGDLVTYLQDTDVADQLVDWIKEETGVRKVFIRPALKIISILVFAGLKKTGKYAGSVAAEKYGKLLKKLPFYDKLAACILSLRANLESGARDKQIVQDILSGKRPPHDDDYGKTLALDMRLTLMAIEKDEEFHTEARGYFDKIIDLLIPQPPIHVRLAEPKDENRLVYCARRVPFMGRKSDMLALNEFLDSDPEFCWWLITGPGGMGKSRLALELCLRQAMPWRIGFLPEEHEFTNWANWQPDQPTCLIIDYVAKHAKDIGKIIRALRCRTEPFDWPVRILLLEREIQDTWWKDFRGSSSGRVDIDESQYKEPRPLASLSDDDTWAIICHIAGEEVACEADRDDILAKLHEIDKGCRPLFTAMVADAIKAGNDIRHWDKARLLEDVLKREEEKFWKPAGFNERDKNLLALATMTGGTPIEWLKTQKTPIPFPTNEGDADKQLDVSKFETVTGISITDTIPPYEPDIVGEFFVMEHLKPKNIADTSRLKNMRDCAWELNPVEFLYFLIVIKNDFGLNDTYNHMRNIIPKTETQKLLWFVMAIDLIIYCGYHKEYTLFVEMHSQVVEKVKEFTAGPDINVSQIQVAINLIDISGETGFSDTFPHIQELYRILIDLSKEYPSDHPIQKILMEAVASYSYTTID